MIAYTKYLLLGFVMVTAMACTKGDPANPDGGVIGPACVDDSGCSGELGVCDTNGTKKCVQCVAAADPAESASCAAAAPVCAMGNVCRKCTAHSECTASQVCAPEGVTDGAMAVAAGTCIDAAKVAYADAIAPATNTTCTKDLPCNTLQAAIDRDRKFVKASGELVAESKAPSTTVQNKTVAIFSGPNASLRSYDKDSPSLIVKAMGASSKSEVTIFGLTFVGPTTTGIEVGDKSTVNLFGSRISGATISGISLGNPSSEVKLNDTKVSGNPGDGIIVNNGTLNVAALSAIEANAKAGIVVNKGITTIVQSNIIGNTGIGVNLTDGELTLSRSTIRANGAGGITVANNKKFTIASNFIVGNLGNGGVNIAKPASMSKFEFNTVVDNTDTGTGVTDAGGVFCDDAAFDFNHNIIFRNIGGQGGFKQTAGTCTFNNSYIGSQTEAEAVPTVLAFKNDTTDPRDYRLTSASPSGATGVRDVSAAVCTGLTDVDGEARPKAGTCDLGADEY